MNRKQGYTPYAYCAILIISLKAGSYQPYQWNTMTDDTLPSVRDALLRYDLATFIEKSFHTVNPSTPFQPNWHINLTAAALEEVASGSIKRLIINMPPRSLKSLCVSVAWPAWILGNNPAARIMAASYSQSLSLKHSLDTRLIMNAPWYKRMFPKVIMSPDQNEKAKFTTTKRGFRFATSVGGTATGEGGNILIVDDPLNPMQAASDILRQSALDWLDQTFMSRLDDKQHGVIVIVMQRLHDDDITGHLLKKSPLWHHLCLPAIATERQIFHYGNVKIIRKSGDILHPGREGKKLLEQARIELGNYAFAAQYQQQPVPMEGTMMRPEWLRYYDHTLPEDAPITQSWDTAIKTGKANDYSVCTTWAEVDHHFYLLDLVQRRMEYPDLKRALLATADKWQPQAILIEDKASGQSLLQDIRRETTLPVIAIRPLQDKITRFASVTALFEAGKILLPRNTPWRALYETELLSFPGTSHDDMVDSTSQYLCYSRNRGSEKMRIRML
jgi:predicted phage terminase large subunit-like protein